MQVSLKKLVVVNFCILLFLSMGMYALAQTPTSTFWISPGVYPGAPSYTIWNEGSNYFAKDGEGQIDFSGTSATSVIQSALTNGEEVFITSGTYLLTMAPGYNHTLLMSNDNHLRGEGKTSILKLADNEKAFTLLTTWDTFPTLPLTPKYRITVEDLMIDGNFANQGWTTEGWQGAGITFYDMHYSTIRNVYVKDCGKYGGIVFSGSNNLITGNVVENVGDNAGSQGYGIFVTAIGTNHNTISHNRIFNLPKGGGIIIEDFVKYTDASFNKIYNITGGSGISIATSEFLTLHANTIVNITGGRGIVTDVPNNVNTNELIVSSNYIDECDRECIYITANNSVIIGNIVKNADNGEYGGVGGIAVDAWNCTIVGNRAFDDQAVKTQDYGIATGAINTVIVGNYVTGNDVAGIYNTSICIIEHNQGQ